jgi:ABC-type branched-subunit amino acid transport system substrate-binding protein
MSRLQLFALAAASIVASACCAPASAEKKYGPGVTDTEIKIGNIAPYSGPASAFGILGRVQDAYFKKINSEGGINGRKINFISYDDAYSPPKTVEQARKLVESDEVLLIFGPIGTPGNAAIQKYMNSKKVPQLFVASGSSRWNDPKAFPWTMGWLGTFESEARIYAKYLLTEAPAAKIAVLYQNDDFGKDYLKGLKAGLQGSTTMIVAEESYETSEPTIDSHIVKLKASGADVFLNFSSPKFAAQAIKKIGEIGWRPLHILSSTSVSIGNVIKPAGFENAQNIVSSVYLKDPAIPQWANDTGVKAFDQFMSGHFPEGRGEILAALGYTMAQTLEEVLKRCGDDLSRENVMAQAANLQAFAPSMLQPGITINTSATDFSPIKQSRLTRFKGDTWELFGDAISAEPSAR